MTVLTSVDGDLYSPMCRGMNIVWHFGDCLVRGRRLRGIYSQGDAHEGRRDCKPGRKDPLSRRVEL